MYKIAKISGISGLLVLMLPIAVSAKTVSGTVAALHGSTIVLAAESGSLNVDASGTNVQSRFGTKLDLTDINTGDSLRVSGEATTGSDSNLSATNIRDLSNQQRKAGFMGTVSAVSSTGFALQIKGRADQTVTVSSDTKITKQDKTAALSDITVGASVAVNGTWDASKNTIEAARVVIIVRTVNVTGVVSAVSGTTITLNKSALGGKNEGENHGATTDTSTAPTSSSVSTTAPATWTVDASNAKLMKRFGGVMQLSDIQNGDTLQVNGTVVGNTITAKTVRDTSLQQRNGTFVGTISALNGSSFSLQSKERGTQTINTTSSTKFLLGNAAGSISSLGVGQTVVVSGTWDRTNNNVTANRVMVKMVGENINAVFKSASGTTLTVLGSDNVTYTVDASHARLRGAGGAMVSVSAFTSGDSLRISGKMVSGSTSITANEIRDLNLKTAPKNETGNTDDLVKPIAPTTPVPVPAPNPAQ